MQLIPGMVRLQLGDDRTVAEFESQRAVVQGEQKTKHGWRLKLFFEIARTYSSMERRDEAHSTS